MVHGHGSQYTQASPLMAESGLSFALARPGRLLTRHTPHAVRLPAAHCGIDPFYRCSRAGLWSGAASLRSLQPARRGIARSLAAKTRDDDVYVLSSAVRGEHPP